MVKAKRGVCGMKIIKELYAKYLELIDYHPSLFILIFGFIIIGCMYGTVYTDKVFYFLLIGIMTYCFYKLFQIMRYTLPLH